MTGLSRQRLADLASRGRRQLAPIAVCVCVAATGCASGDGSAGGTPTPPATPSVSATQTEPSGPTVAPSTPPGVASQPRLLVLADGVDGGVGLWICASGTWSAGSPLPGATAIGRDGSDLVVAANGSLESRAAASPQTLVASLDPKWAKEPPSGSIVSLDRSTAGATAIAVTSPSGVTFAVVEADGTAAELTPAPDSPFGPSVAWLDKDRLVVISEDSRQIPRLAVVDRLKGKIDLLGAIGGMRVFGLSPDRATLAAATESEVYVAPVGDWLANKEVAPAVSLKPSEVVWDLAVSADNSHLAMLSGTLDASGTATDIHEIGYVHSGSSWVEAFDLSVPFSRAAGQVWLD